MFIVKENHTFDNLFGTFPGADGATTGKTCGGKVVLLRRAKDQTPDVGHQFINGVMSVDGGRMDCFNRHPTRRPDLGAYVSLTAGVTS